MDINNIVVIMPAPNGPFDVPARDEWVSIESKIGTALPDDYKEFIQVYGTGKIDDFLWIFNPFSKNKYGNLIEQARVKIDVLAELRFRGENIPYNFYPEEGGLLPFGMTDNGDVLYWRTAGAPNTWTVLVNEARAPEWENFGMSMSDFLLGILTQRISCSIFPRSFPGPLPISFALVSR